MYPDNNWYSHKEILNKYIGEKIKVYKSSIQHGSITVTYDKFFGKVKFPFINYLVWNKKALDICRQNGNRNSSIIGSPFIYLNDIMKHKNYKAKPKSYFIFVPHSAEYIPGPFYHSDFISFAKKKFKGRLTVCFFYKDLNSKLKKLYGKNKIKVFSCGKRKNKNYLFSLFVQMKLNENIVITELGSPLFYSLFLEKNTYFVDSFTPSVTPKKFIRQEMNYKKKYEFLYDKLPKNKKVNAYYGKKLANYELGIKYMKKKEDLKKLLVPNNIFFKIYTEICKFLIYLKWKNKLIQ